MATLMRPDGSTEEIESIHLVSYKELGRLLDGPVEYVNFQDGRALLVNGEFKYRDFPFNLKATTLIDGHYDKVHGSAIIISAAEFDVIKRHAAGECGDDR